MGSPALPSAPHPGLISLPSTMESSPDPAAPKDDIDRETDVSYPSISSGERAVFYTKYGRFRQWTKGVTKDGGPRTAEDRMGEAVGAESAVWSHRGSMVSAGTKSLVRPTTNGSHSGHDNTKADSRSSRSNGQAPTENGRQPESIPQQLSEAVALTRGQNVPLERPARRVLAPVASFKPPFTPYLAAPPVRTAVKTPQPAPGEVLFPYPTQSASRAQRDAYLSSALSLPLDMLTEEIDGQRVPSAASSVLTGGRIASLLSERQSPSGIRERSDVPHPNAEERSDPTRTISPPTVNGKGSRKLSPASEHASVPRNNEKRRDPSTTKRRLGVEAVQRTATGYLGAQPPLRTARTAQTGGIATTTREIVAHPLPATSATWPATEVGVPVAKAETASGSQYPLYEPSLIHRTLKSEDTQAGIQAGQGMEVPQKTASSKGTLLHPVTSATSHRARLSSDTIKRLADSSNSNYETVRSSRSRGSQRSRHQETSGGHAPLSPPRQSAPQESVPSLGSRGSYNSHRNAATLPVQELSQSSTYRGITSAKSSEPTRSPRPAKSIGSQNVAPFARVSSQRNVSVAVANDEPSYLPYAKAPTPVPEIPVTHRQQLPLPRPALSRQGSSADLLGGTLGRRHRDPSSANLTARFPPEMYPLPPSGTDSDTVLLSPATPSGTVPIPRQISRSRVQSSKTSVNITESRPTFATTPKSGSTSSSAVPRSPSGADPYRHRPVLQFTSPIPPIHNTTGPTTVPLQEQPSPGHHLLTPVDDLNQYPHASQIPSEHPTYFLPSSPPANASTAGADHLSFEVPSGNRGRLRVSLAWFRDSSRSERRAESRSRDNGSEVTASSAPPPVPPKSPPASSAARVKESRSPKMAHRANPFHFRDLQDDNVRGSRDDRRLETSADVDRRQNNPPTRSAPQARPDEGSPSVGNRETYRPQIVSPGMASPFHWPGSPVTPFGPAPTPFGMRYPAVHFAYPQPGIPTEIYPTWPSPGLPMPGPNGPPSPLYSNNFTQSRAVPSRAPPSPPRPQSIEPPSSRGSPSPGPTSQPQASANLNEYLHPTLNINPGASFVRPWWALPPPRRGHLSRFFGRSSQTDQNRGQEGNDDDNPRLRSWRSKIIPGRAPTVAPMYNQDPNDYGREALGRTGGWSGFFRPRRDDRAQGYYGTIRRTREEPAPLPPLSSGVGPGFGGYPMSHRFSSRFPIANRWDDPYRAERQRAKEERRRAKAERRDRREAHSQESLPRMGQKVRNGFGGMSMGNMFGLGFLQNEAQNGRYKGLKIRSPYSNRLPRDKTNLIKLNGGLPWQRQNPQGKFGSWVEMLRPRARSMQTPYQAPRTSPRMDTRGMNRNVPARQTNEERRVRPNARPDGMKRKLSAKKWSDRNREKKRR